ncbi:metal ABC transporter permease [bacterium]|nr:MAG: metal ABC transporter permease [bacterium]
MTNQLFLSLISGIAVGGVAGYLGALMLQKRMALVAGPLGHLAFPGVALALIYGFNVSLGAFPFIILGIFLIWLLEIKTNIPTEALTALVFATGVSVSFLFLPIEEAETALIGNITSIGWQEALITILLSLVVFGVVKKIFSQMILINISEDLAKTEGINIKKYNLIYLLSIAVIVALGVKLVGVLLTAALVAVPAATARNLSKSMKKYVFLSIFFGILAPIIGLIIYKITDLPAGVLIIISGAVLFLLSMFFKDK